MPGFALHVCVYLKYQEEVIQNVQEDLFCIPKCRLPSLLLVVGQFVFVRLLVLFPRIVMHGFFIKIKVFGTT